MPAAVEDIREALTHLAHDAARLTWADPTWAAKHARINTLLDQLQQADA